MKNSLLKDGQVKLSVNNISIEAEGKNAELLVGCACILLLSLSVAAILRSA